MRLVLKKIWSKFKINKLRSKLQSYFLVLILLAAAMGAVSYTYIQRITLYHSLRNQIDELLVSNNRLSKYEQKFINEDVKTARFQKLGESIHLDRYRKTNRHIHHLLDDLEQNPLTSSLKAKENFQAIRYLNRQHHKVFMSLVSELKRRGFQDYGLEGKMRSAIHQLLQVDSLDQASLLMLRRHEKDFLLRKDEEYADKLKAEANQLLRSTRNGLVNPQDSTTLANMAVIQGTVQKYLSHFDQIVKIEMKIGVDEDSGIKGELNKTIQLIDQELEGMDEYIDQNVDILVANSQSLIVTFFVVFLIIAAVFGLILSIWISNPIITLNRVAKSVTLGLRNQEQFLDRIRRNDEIGSLARNFKLMLIRLRETIQQADDKNRKLEELAQEEARRNWHSEGLSIFNEIFRKNHDRLEQQAFELISELVKYTKSNQGGLFVINREDEKDVFLELKGCYAYERKKYQKKRIDWGEGLVGTAWKEGHSISIEDVPQDYVAITSGLGKATPNCLLIVPIKSADGIQGVIELISFGKYQPYEIEFIEAVAQRMAHAIISLKANEKTRTLLETKEEIAQQAREKEATLQKQLDHYKDWVEQFETRLNDVSEEALIYQSIVGKVYDGLIITDEYFRINKVNRYVADHFHYQEKDLAGESIDVLIEREYDNVLDLKDKQFKLNFKLFDQNVRGTIVDSQGNNHEVEIICGKLEIEAKLVYIFLFNETKEASKNNTQNTKLKVAS